MIEIGPHLLGRRPMPTDERDWPLAAFLATDDPLQQALAVLQASRAVAPATKAWAAAATARILAVSPPAQPATPTGPAPGPDGEIIWADSATAGVLNQGNTPHCVGFAWAQFGNTDPVDDEYGNADGDLIYAECKAIDGEPGKEDGSDTRSGATAMRNRGRIDAYAFAASLDEVIAWVRTSGPVVFGTLWYQSMFQPDAAGMLTVDPASGVAGGHEWVCVGDRPTLGALECLNSWGDGWGRGGRFTLRYADAAALLKTGEACTAVELPKAAA